MRDVASSKTVRIRRQTRGFRYRFTHRESRPAIVLIAPLAPLLVVAVLLLTGRMIHSAVAFVFLALVVFLVWSLIRRWRGGPEDIALLELGPEAIVAERPEYKDLALPWDALAGADLLPDEYLTFFDVRGRSISTRTDGFDEQEFQDFLQALEGVLAQRGMVRTVWPDYRVTWRPPLKPPPADTTARAGDAPKVAAS